jgi:hypothetical protein
MSSTGGGTRVTSALRARFGVVKTGGAVAILNAVSSLRPAALIAAGALAVHELRYALAGGGATDALDGHGYVPLAGLGCGVLLALACGHLLARVARTRRSGPGESGGIGFRLAWTLAAASLLGIFLAQELLEGLLATGRAASLGAVVGAGGWTALPLAVALGGLVALVITIARAAVAAAALTGARGRRGRAPAGARPLITCLLVTRPPVLAANLAGRAPPVVS